MATDNIEETLKNMTKPEVHQLKHESMLAGMMVKAKGRLVASFWWLCIPAYLVAALLMKSWYVPGTSLRSNVHELLSRNSYIAIPLFLVLPIMLIIINGLSIKQLFFLYNSLTTWGFLKTIAVQLLVIIFSLFVLLFYFL